MESKKNPKVDIGKNSSIYFALGTYNLFTYSNVGCGLTHRGSLRNIGKWTFRPENKNKKVPLQHRKVHF